MPESFDRAGAEVSDCRRDVRVAALTPQLHTAGVEFLDQDWAAEFDRRLAVWQADSPEEAEALPGEDCTA